MEGCALRRGQPTPIQDPVTRQSRERGQSAEEGLFPAEEKRKNALPLPKHIFKCLFKFLFFRCTASELREADAAALWILDGTIVDGEVPLESHLLEPGIEVIHPFKFKKIKFFLNKIGISKKNLK